ncbi:MAG TPA: 3-hydroxybutyrate dehydrogenase [Planktothrix sp.]
MTTGVTLNQGSGARESLKPLEGKVAIVTGSTSGIGLGIAKGLAAQGCAVVLNGLGEAQAIENDRVALEQEAQVTVRYHSADMMDPAAIRDLVRFTVEKLGSADIIVNNAGIQYTAPCEEFPDEKWDAILAINLSSAFHLAKAALPEMKRRNWGRIINVASVHGLVASAEKAAYVAAKHGLIGLTKVIALECAATGVTCNAICPGWVRTPLVEAQIQAIAKKNGLTIEEATNELLSEKQPSQRFTEVEHLAAMAVFLCSDAASNITGTQQVLDGGWTAR